MRHKERVSAQSTHFNHFCLHYKLRIDILKLCLIVPFSSKTVTCPLLSKHQRMATQQPTTKQRGPPFRTTQPPTATRIRILIPAGMSTLIVCKGTVMAMVMLPLMTNARKSANERVKSRENFNQKWFTNTRRTQQPTRTQTTRTRTRRPSKWPESWFLRRPSQVSGKRSDSNCSTQTRWLLIEPIINLESRQM